MRKHQYQFVMLYVIKNLIRIAFEINFPKCMLLKQTS